METNTETVMLRTGVESTRPVVNTIMYILQTLFAERPVYAYELVMICRDRNHVLFGNSAAELRSRHLLEPNGQPHDLIRDVVNAAVVGEDFDMRLQSPLA